MPKPTTDDPLAALPLRWPLRWSGATAVVVGLGTLAVAQGTARTQDSAGLLATTAAIISGSLMFLAVRLINAAANAGRSHRADQALLASEHRLVAVTAHASEAIVGTRDDGRIILWNPAAERLFGWDGAQAQEHSIADMIVPANQSSFREILKKIAEMPTTTAASLLLPNTALQRTAIHRDGHLFPIDVSLSTWVEQDQRYFVSLIRDRSQQLAIEQELRHARDQAEASSREKSSFLVNMSHELRTPLSAVLGMADLLARSRPLPEQAKWIQTIRNSAELLVALVDDALDVSKLQFGEFPLEDAVFNLRRTIDHAVDCISHRAHQKGLHVQVDVLDNVPMQVRGDARRLTQILTNLLTNAVKFTDAGSVTLRVQAEQANGLSFAVQDTGIGIDPQHFPNIFKAFSQVDPSPSRRHTGTGLGLAISRSLAQQMDGDIDVQSTPGRGSTFTLHIQLATELMPAVILHDAPLDLRGMTVLIVATQPTQLGILENELNRLGAEVHCADTPAAAFEKMAQPRRPELVFVDAAFSPMGGLPFVVELRSQRPAATARPKFVLIRAEEDSLDMTRMRRAGPISTLRKPIRRHEIANAIRPLLATPQPKDDPALIDQPAQVRILVVDDSLDNRVIVRSFLRDSVWAITEAGSGPEALALWKPGAFDLILMDVQMPDMDGYAVVEQIRAAEREFACDRVPILALTAHGRPEDLANSAAAGCDGHITKPIRRGQLVDFVCKFTKSHLDLAAGLLAQDTGPGRLITPSGPANLPEVVYVDALLEPLIPDYLEGRKNDIQRIATAQAKDDFAEIRRLGHSMKGSGSSYGFDAISTFGALLEDSALAQDGDGILNYLELLRQYLVSVRVVAGPQAALSQRGELERPTGQTFPDSIQ